MILVGNKCDLEAQRIISKVRAQEFASQNQVRYIETSALNNINVAESVQSLLNAVMERLEQSQTPGNPHPHQLRLTHEQITKELLASHTKKKPKVSLCCSY